MRLGWTVRLGAAAIVMLLASAQSNGVAAQGFDPASTVGAYQAALNTHNLAAALALFDKNGSATDEQGQHFEGVAGLTTFLVSRGIGNPDARVSTMNLRVIGNRAVWTYTCSCATDPMEVRVVTNQDKITVFFVRSLPAASRAAASTALAAEPGPLPLPWLLEAGLAMAILAVAISRRRRRTSAPPTRPSQGRLLASLAQSRRVVHDDQQATLAPCTRRRD